MEIRDNNGAAETRDNIYKCFYIEPARKDGDIMKTGMLATTMELIDE